ncbi:uncharacterized protein B0H18DRAFT_863370, partial [Fomitopsis serialis]|uniref:uncharacterized protein n=1 Tax=Fomitopsis serialis TaxID=139415 RepID=UPI0020082DA5
PSTIPQLICMWIIDLCDETNLKGETKAPGDVRSSYSYAMKMRAAVTHAYSRIPTRGTTPWHQGEDGTWKGNPSMSVLVSRYMISLRRRKTRAGHQTQSSRAITSGDLEAMYKFNHLPHNWEIKPLAPKSRTDTQSLDEWAGGRLR